jgi:WD40 repeat protein
MSPDGRWALASHTPYIWDLRSTESASLPHRLAGTPAAGSFSLDSRWLAIAYEDGTLDLKNLQAGVTAASTHLVTRTGPSSFLEFSRDGRWFVANSGERLLLWHTSRPAAPPVVVANGKGSYGFGAEFSEDGRWLVTTGSGQPTVWDLTASTFSEPAVTLQSPTGWTIEFSDGGHWLIAHTKSATMLWSPTLGWFGGRPISIPDSSPEDSEEPRSVWITPDGRFLVTRSNTVTLWPLRTRELEKMAERD